MEYKKGCQNYVADALSRIRPQFEIRYKNSDIFESNNPLVHCISKDKKLSKGFAEQVKSHYPLQNLFNLDNKIFIQKQPRLILHHITKNLYYEKPTSKNIKACLEKLFKYCIQNEITELDLPRICSGLDKFPWLEIKNCIKKIFENSSIIFNVYEEPSNL